MWNLHEWNLSYAEARQLQMRLAGRVRLRPLAKEPELIAGLDCAFSRDGRQVIAAVIVPRVTGSRSPACFEFEPVETASAEEEMRFPYIPGLLSFREAPACLAHQLVTKLRS
jgi:deoxyribonuclease V